MTSWTKIARASRFLAWTPLGAVLLVACGPSSGSNGGMGGTGAGDNGAAACPTGVDAPGTVPATPWLHVEGNQIEDPHGNVVILRGVAFPDLGDLQFWEGGINAMIDRVTSGSDMQGCSPSWQTRVL